MLKMSYKYNFNICLDLTIEISSLEANTSVFIKEINYKNFDYKKSNSNKPMREALKLNYNKKSMKFKNKKHEIPKRNNNENEFHETNFNKNKRMDILSILLSKYFTCHKYYTNNYLHNRRNPAY